jgi:hypothetical protein
MTLSKDRFISYDLHETFMSVVNITYTFTTARVLHLSQKKVAMFWSALALQICELTRLVSNK